MTVEKKKIWRIPNFKTLWIRYDASSSDRHQLFIKEHSVRNQDLPKGRTLFVLNIPPYATSQSIQNIFTESCGPVNTVTFQKKPNTDDVSFRTAYVVFAKEKGLEKALSLTPKHTLTLSSEKSPVLSGIEKWCKNYNESIVGEEEIKKRIDNYMNEYDRKIEGKIESEKTVAETVDEDGWTTITGRKKRGQFSLARKESTIQKVQLKEAERKQKKQLQNFNAYQIRESKKQNLAEMRRKFELDKKKLELIKSKRNFKPF